MKKRIVYDVNTTDGKRYLLGRVDSDGIMPLRYPGRMYKTKKGAQKALKKYWG